MILSALLLSMAQAAAPARPAPQATAQQRPSPGARLRQLGLSEAGLQTLRRVESARAAEVQRIVADLRAVNAEIRSLIAAPTIDTARLGSALRRRDPLRANLEPSSPTSLLEGLRLLSPADQAILVRNIGLVRPAPRTAPPARR